MSSSTPSTGCVLEAVGVEKIYPGTVALKGVDVRLRSGHVHALIGENGAGKSTLVKILAGIEQPTSGRLRLDGADIQLRSARDASDRGISIIHQELQLFPNLSVTDNLFLGRERVTSWGTVDRTAQTESARDVLRRLGQVLDPEALVETLPVGQQQLVEIARALIHNARVLLMDEPTSALSAAETHVLFQIVRDLASRGVAIVYISHRLQELLEVADSVTVLRDGVIVGEASTTDVSLSWIVERMTGRSTGPAQVHSARHNGVDVLSVRGVSLDSGAGGVPVQNISFDVHAGEILGVYGLLGAGRTELFEALVGLHRNATGEIWLSGRRIDAMDTADRVRRRNRDGARGSAARRIDSEPLGAGQPDAVQSWQPFQCRVRLPCQGAGRRRTSGDGTHGESAVLKRSSDLIERWEPAEGGDRTGAHGPSAGAAAGRADARRRRRRQGGNHPAHEPLG